MKCPKCNSEKYCKDGWVLGRQRYQCKLCRFRYSVERKSDVKPVETRRLALELYLEGMGFRAIGRVLKVNYATVYYWVKHWGSQVTLPKREEPVAVVELDEMHTYVKSKKTTVGYGLLLIDLEKDFSLLSVATALGKRD